MDPLTNGEVNFSTEQEKHARLFIATFRVNAKMFVEQVRRQTHVSTNVSSTELSKATYAFFLQKGIDLSPPKTVFFNEHEGVLLFRATVDELGSAEKLLGALKLQPVPDRIYGLVQDAMSLYAGGKLDEAIAKLKQARAINPSNTVVRYYLNVVDPSTRVQNFIHALQSVRVSKISFNKAPLKNVATYLSNIVQQKDPEERDFEIYIDQTKSSNGKLGLGDVAVTIRPALTNITMAEALEAIANGADKPIKYAITDKGVVLSWKGQEQSPLFARTFKVDTKIFVANLSQQAGLAAGATQIELAQALWELLVSKGVDLSAPKSIFFNDFGGTVFVRATLSDLDVVEKEVAKLNTPPPKRITIRIKIY